MIECFMLLHSEFDHRIFFHSCVKVRKFNYSLIIRSCPSVVLASRSSHFRFYCRQFAIRLFILNIIHTQQHKRITHFKKLRPRFLRPIAIKRVLKFSYKKMRFVALVSGGKDSIYSILQAIRNGHELVACVHLGAPATISGDKNEDGTEIEQEESYMYQTAASEVVKTQVEECLGVELLLYPRQGRSVNTGLVYENTTPNDEVEDLFLALELATKRFNFEGVCSGAILSTYQRVRIEHVCNRLGLTSLSYMWRLLPQKQLLQQMLDDGIEAVLVKVACPPGLVPRKHLNKTLRFLSDIGLLEKLHQQYQFHVCGEGGEYESLVIDSPLYKKKLVLDEVEIIEPDSDGVGELRILACHAEEKVEGDIPLLEQLEQQELQSGRALRDTTKSSADTTTPTPTPTRDNHDDTVMDQSTTTTITPSISYTPQVYRGTGGLLHFSEIISPVTATSPLLAGNNKSEAELAVEEAKQIFSILEKGLQSHGATSKDVLFVHLYLSEISHFATINVYYQAFFGSLLPPSRSCVAVGRRVLPGGRRVLLDCIVQIGSGEYMRSSTNATSDVASHQKNPYSVAAHNNMTSKLREVLHVQSISQWAPVCVGPYSQVNTLRSGLQFLAGQIGLIPETMTLQPTWTLQLEQCWKNVASVLDALNGSSLKDIFGSLIYISEKVYQEEKSIDLLASISTSQIRNNGSIIAGEIDSLQDTTELYGGYEDQATWEEMKSDEDIDESLPNPCPILVVCIPEMPKGAIVEVEVITTTVDVAKSLEQRDADYSIDCSSHVTPICASSVGWESGHDFGPSLPANEGIRIDSFARVVGHGCAAVALITASRSTNTTSNKYEIQSDYMLDDMISSAVKVLSKARAGLDTRNIVHIRLFYVSSEQSTNGEYVVNDDGVQLRASLRAIISSKVENNRPAISVIPVKGLNTIGMLPKEKGNVNSGIMFAMQVLIFDPIHLETEVWIHKDRD